MLDLLIATLSRIGDWTYTQILLVLLYLVARTWLSRCLCILLHVLIQLDPFDIESGILRGACLRDLLLTRSRCALIQRPSAQVAAVSQSSSLLCLASTHSLLEAQCFFDLLGVTGVVGPALLQRLACQSYLLRLLLLRFLLRDRVYDDLSVATLGARASLSLDVLRYLTCAWSPHHHVNCGAVEVRQDKPLLMRALSCSVGI